VAEEIAKEGTKLTAARGILQLLKAWKTYLKGTFSTTRWFTF
jgi:hypothetical protein